MTSDNRRRGATRSVWRRSYETCRARPGDWWAAVTPALTALMAELRTDPDEDALQARYWALGDLPGQTLRRYLPADTDDEAVLELEEAALWLRLRELCADG